LRTLWISEDPILWLVTSKNKKIISFLAYAREGLTMGGLPNFRPTGLGDLKSGRRPWGDLLVYKKVLAKFGNLWGFWKNSRRHSPSTRVFLSLSHLVPSATDPGELSLPSLSLSPSRSSVCLSTAPHTFPTYAHCLALHLNTEVPYCGGPGSRTLIEKATRLILQKLLQPWTESL
jgi:hypothetical protein